MLHRKPRVGDKIAWPSNSDVRQVLAQRLPQGEEDKALAALPPGPGPVYTVTKVGPSMGYYFDGQNHVPFFIWWHESDHGLNRQAIIVEEGPEDGAEEEEVSS